MLLVCAVALVAYHGSKVLCRSFFVEMVDADDDRGGGHHDYPSTFVHGIVPFVVEEGFVRFEGVHIVYRHKCVHFEPRFFIVVVFCSTFEYMVVELVRAFTTFTAGDMVVCPKSQVVSFANVRCL